MEHKRNCIVCGKQLLSADSYDQFSSPISEGISFTSRGNYGSAVFDGGEFTGEYLELYVCDQCLIGKGHKIYLCTRSKVEQGEYNISLFSDRESF